MGKKKDHGPRGFKAHPSRLFTWAHRAKENRDWEHCNSQVPQAEAGLMKPPGASLSCVGHMELSLPLLLHYDYVQVIMWRAKVHGLRECYFYIVKQKIPTEKA